MLPVNTRSLMGFYHHTNTRPQDFLTKLAQAMRNDPHGLLDQPLDNFTLEGRNQNITIKAIASENVSMLERMMNVSLLYTKITTYT